MEGALVRLDAAKRAVALAIAEDDSDSLFTLRAMASAAELARTRTGAMEAANDAGEIKVRAERGLAILDVQAQPGNTRHDLLGDGNHPAPLADVDKNARAQIRKLAALDDDEFEKRLAAAHDDEIAGVSTKRVLANQSVTYKNQPGIDATGGSVPLNGTSHVYRVEKLLWPEAVEDLLEGLIIPRSLHVCAGMSKLGDIRLDNDPAKEPDIVADAANLPFDDDEFESVLCDPPYNGDFQWNHSLLDELARVASRRIIFQHWFIPANPDGRYKKAQDKFALSSINVWQPKTYFGRAQLISTFDRV